MYVYEITATLVLPKIKNTLKNKFIEILNKWISDCLEESFYNNDLIEYGFEGTYDVEIDVQFGAKTYTIKYILLSKESRNFDKLVEYYDKEIFGDLFGEDVGQSFCEDLEEIDIIWPTTQKVTDIAFRKYFVASDPKCDDLNQNYTNHKTLLSKLAINCCDGAKYIVFDGDDYDIGDGDGGNGKCDNSNDM